MASGKQTREYRAVLKNMGAIRESLDVNDGAKTALTDKYMENEWIDITAKNVSFAILALSKISNDASQYRTFVDMLKRTVGMDDVAKKIEGVVAYIGQGCAEHFQMEFPIPMTKNDTINASRSPDLSVRSFSCICVIPRIHLKLCMVLMKMLGISFLLLAWI